MQYRSGYRLSSAILALAMVLASTVALAETRKANDPSMGFDNPTVGTFGKSQGSGPGSSAAAPARPSAPVAAPPPPKVEAESPAILPLSAGSPAALPAAPRADAKVEGQAVGSGPPMIGTGAPPVDGFLAGHPLLSGLVAGLLGSDLGSLLYGGPMMGNETAADLGLLLRVLLVVLLGVLLVRGLARRMLGPTQSPYAPREPTFARSPGEEPGGRREPRL